jgi:hypothetical protein
VLRHSHPVRPILVYQCILDAKHLECDQTILKLSEEKLREILEEVRKLRNRRKKRVDDLRKEEEKEVLYVNS